LVHADWAEKREGRLWGPPGRFAWGSAESIQDKLEQEIRSGDSPPVDSLIKAGLFDGSMERFEQIKKSFNEFIDRLNWRS